MFSIYDSEIKRPFWLGMLLVNKSFIEVHQWAFMASKMQNAPPK